jgi:hypothetical protein
VSSLYKNDSKKKQDMSDHNEDYYVKTCLQKIEAQLNWGDNQNWSNYDFEKLSADIEAKTHIVLSVTTLKRIWGKVKYPHSPTVTTLNTLAQFLDYADWRAFKQNGNGVADELEFVKKGQEVKPLKTENFKSKKGLMVFITALIICFLAMFYSFFSHKKTPNNAKKIDAMQYQFEANKMITEGVPNSVVFTYDASKAQTDSIFIVQTWDIRRKTLVSKTNHHHSAIYYYPGFFRSKLIIDSTIVKTHDIQISTNGWLCLAENDDVPLYFTKQECEKDGVVEVDKNILAKYNLTLHPKAPRIRFFNQSDMGDLMNDNFSFETTLKNDFTQGSNACQNVEVLIQCKDDIIIIPLASKACVGNLHLYAAGIEVSSQQADLSKFGCDLTQWTHLKVVSKNKHITFYVNGTEAYSLTFPHEPTGIVGVQCRFNGLGAVKNTSF